MAPGRVAVLFACLLLYEVSGRSERECRRGTGRSHSGPANEAPPALDVHCETWLDPPVANKVSGTLDSTKHGKKPS